MKYRKKPVEVEAIQFMNTMKSIKNIVKYFPDIKLHSCAGNVIRRQTTIKTLEGDMKANKGDWIVRGIVGEFYPVKNDIFEKTYEKTEENENE